MEARSPVPVSIWLAAAVGAVATWAQLYLRFSERRPFEALKTTLLFVFIGLFAGAVSGALTSIPLFLPVGGEVAGAAVGLGTSVPFSQEQPEGPLDTRSTKIASEITRALKKLLAITALMSSRLDRLLSAAKTRRVGDVIRKINELSQDDDYPPFERVNNGLKSLIANLTGKERDRYKGKLKYAYRKCKTEPEPLERLISLAYDMGQEGLILDQAREMARTGKRADPS